MDHCSDMCCNGRSTREVKRRGYTSLFLGPYARLGNSFCLERASCCPRCMLVGDCGAQSTTTGSRVDFTHHVHDRMRGNATPPNFLVIHHLERHFKASGVRKSSGDSEKRLYSLYLMRVCASGILVLLRFDQYHVMDRIDGRTSRSVSSSGAPYSRH